MPRKNRKPRSDKGKPRGSYAKKAAYAPVRRQATRNMLGPLVETKAYQSGDLGTANYLSNTATAPGTGAFNIIVPNCFYTKEQGIDSHQMVGDSVYSRYLTSKVRLMFPTGNNMLVYPTSITIFQVWVPAPLAATPYTTPGQNNVAQADIELHVKQQCQEFFSSLSDKLEFREKLQGVKIISKRKVRLNRDASIVTPPFAIQTAPAGAPNVVLGGTDDWYGTFRWPCKRKLHYEESQSLVGAGITHYLNRPPSDMGYPALIIYNPNFGDQIVQTPETADPILGQLDRRIKIQFRSKHWFGDQ
jgi:hypothetical protein